MSTTLSPALEERFAGIIAGLHRTLRTHPRRAALAGVLLMLVWNRIGHLGRRFARLAARLRAGNLPKPRSRPASPQPPAERPKPPAPAQRLPSRRGWLSRLLPNIPTHCGAGASAGQLQSLLADPQMRALIAQAPEAMSRILRPLCHMLGVKPDPALLPPRQRTKRAKPPKPPRPEPPPEPEPKPRPRGLCEPPGRYAPGAWVDRVPPHWRDVLEGTVAPRRRHKRKTT